MYLLKLICVFVCDFICSFSLHLVQPTAGPFPPEGTELEEGAIPLPGVSWSAMQPQGPHRLLCLPLWLSLQFLGEREREREGGGGGGGGRGVIQAGICGSSTVLFRWLSNGV